MLLSIRMAHLSCVNHLWDVEVLKGNKKLTDNIWFIHILTIIPRVRVGYEMVDSQLDATHLVGHNHLISNKHEWNNCFIKNAHKISMNLPDFILLEQTGKRQGTSAFHMSHVCQNCQRANGLDGRKIRTLWRWTLLKIHRDSRILHSRVVKKLADDERTKTIFKCSRRLTVNLDFWCSYKSKNNEGKLFPRSPSHVLYRRLDCCSEWLHSLYL